MASGKSLEKPAPHMGTLYSRRDGQPIHMVDKYGKLVDRVRMSKKERLRLRRENEGLVESVGNKHQDEQKGGE
jgi:hypothetical protein